MSGPSWNEEHFAAEKKVVMEEAKEYQSRDDRAFRNGTFLELLPQGHPLRMYNIGTQEQLQALEMADLQDLYYSNYKPGLLTIFVAGNFDQYLNQNEIESLIASSFIAPRDHRASPKRPDLYYPNYQKKFPSIVSDNQSQPRIVELGTKLSTRSLILYFEMPTNKLVDNPEVAEVVIDFLNLKVRGSLYDRLLKKGWVSSLWSDLESVNDLSLAMVQFNLTEEGAKHRYEVPSFLFAALQDIASRGIETEILDMLIQRNIDSYQKNFRQPDAIISMLLKGVQSSRDLQSYLNLKARFNSVTPDKVKNAARWMFPDSKLIVGYMGPEIRSDALSEVFQRPKVLLNHSQVFAKWKKIAQDGLNGFEPIKPVLSGLSFPKALEPISAPNREARILSTDLPGTTILIHENHSSTHVDVHLRMRTAAASVEKRVALSLASLAFVDRYRAEFESLEAQGLNVQVGADRSIISFVVSGNRTAVSGAMLWILEAFKNYVPSQELLTRIKDRIKTSVEKKQQDFAARQVLQAAERVLSRHGVRDHEFMKVMNKISADKVRDLKNLTFKRNDKIWAWAGDVDESLVVDIAKKVKSQMSPYELTEIQRSRASAERLPVNQNMKFWSKLPEIQPLETYAIARTHAAVPLLSDKHAASLVFAEALGSKVFEVNRAREGLGYIHGASASTGVSGVQIRLYGATTGTDNWRKIRQGWEEVIQMVRDRKLSPTHFKDEILGLVRSIDLESGDPSQFAHSMVSSFVYYGKVDASKDLLEQFEALTPERIYQIAEEVLLQFPKFEVVMTHQKAPACANYLTSDTYARRKLMKGSQKQ